MSSGYVLLSGGVDSSTCLAIAKRDHAMYGVTALCLAYGQRHEREVDAARDIANVFNANFELIDISSVIGIGGLTNPDLDIPDKSYAELPEGVSPTYVPFRNGLLLSIAASRAAADPDATTIYYGAHAEDAERDAYPDCSVPFIDTMGAAIGIGTYQRIGLIAPFANKTKADIVRSGHFHGVPWEKTWSCYKGLELHCGVCPTCRARRDAFAAAGVFDPTSYGSDYMGEG